MTLEPVLLPAEIAVQLRMSERNVRRLKAQRLIRIVRLSPRIWGMRPSDIADYHERQLEAGDGIVQSKGRKCVRRERSGNVVSFSSQNAAR